MSGRQALFRAGLLRQPLGKQFDHRFRIGIARTEASGEQVAAARNDFLMIGGHIELAGLAGGEHGFDLQALLDEGGETRSLGLIVLSGGAVRDFHGHGFSISFSSQVTSQYFPNLKPTSRKVPLQAFQAGLH